MARAAPPCAKARSIVDDDVDDVNDVIMDVDMDLNSVPTPIHQHTRMHMITRLLKCQNSSIKEPGRIGDIEAIPPSDVPSSKPSSYNSSLLTEFSIITATH